MTQASSSANAPTDDGGTLRILLVGTDARTDAMAAAVRSSRRPVEVYALSKLAIPGLVAKCEEVRLGDGNDVSVVADYAREIQPGLAIIGPEDPLAHGVVDELTALGIPCVGPSRDLARIESSKLWARALVDEHGIPGNPRYRIFDSEDGLKDELGELGDFVLKPDGLTAGKGVKLFPEHFDTFTEALDYARMLIAESGRVLVEERLEGEEFSLQSITDGETVIHCPVVQDHKRAYKGDNGPNTGGMGSYSCPDFSLPFLLEEEVAEAQRINERVIEALRLKTGEPYRGVLYGGFMATAEGLRLIEYNARFGDPEVMNVLSILATDFVDIAVGVATGHLADVTAVFEPKATVCKYIVPEGYPNGKGHGDVISIPAELLDEPNVRYFWAATEQRGSEITMTGSRALAVVGIGDTLAEAEQRAEKGAAGVIGEVRYRTDIGTAELLARRLAHMSAIRGTVSRP